MKTIDKIKLAFLATGVLALSAFAYLFATFSIEVPTTAEQKQAGVISAAIVLVAGGFFVRRLYHNFKRPRRNTSQPK